MTVKELIEKLQTYPKDMPVISYTAKDKSYSLFDTSLFPLAIKPKSWTILDNNYKTIDTIQVLQIF